MSEFLLMVVGVCYIGTALDLYGRGQQGLAIAFAAYAIANLGLIMAARGA